jgi:hypothetical protein
MKLIKNSLFLARKERFVNIKLILGMLHLTQLSSSECDTTKNLFVNSYPSLFLGGTGDMYDIERGQLSIQD